MNIETLQDILTQYQRIGDTQLVALIALFALGFAALFVWTSRGRRSIDQTLVSIVGQLTTQMGNMWQQIDEVAHRNADLLASTNETNRRQAQALEEIARLVVGQGEHLHQAVKAVDAHVQEIERSGSAPSRKTSEMMAIIAEQIGSVQHDVQTVKFGLEQAQVTLGQIATGIQHASEDLSYVKQVAERAACTSTLSTQGE